MLRCLVFAGLCLMGMSAWCKQPLAHDEGIIVWMIPMVRDSTTTSQADIDRFQQNFSNQNYFTVVNTKIPVLRDQLYIKNHTSPVPNWSTIIAQWQVLLSLKKFAIDNKVHVHVRFIKWDRMFRTLQDTLVFAQGTKGIFSPPDIVQIGSTWVPYFQSFALPIGSDYSIKYTYDVRLLYYWKRLPLLNTTQVAVTLGSSTWPELLRQIASPQVSGPDVKAGLVMPIGLTLNLIHDYAPLVWAGHGKFMTNSPRIDLNSKDALEIPLRLAKFSQIKPGHNRVIGFPEISHVEAMEYFLTGYYRAIIEPVGFLKHWQNHFLKQHADKKFGHYVGISALPVTFRGGSELILTKNARDKKDAVRLIKYLAGDPTHLEVLAKDGYLPAQLKNRGSHLLVQTLNVPPMVASTIESELKKALAQSSTYPSVRNWPTHMESLDSLEAMQSLWRRIAQGDAVKIKQAAALTEQIINRKINTFSHYAYHAQRFWPILATILLISAMLLIGYWRKYIQQQHGQILTLLLFRGKMHSTLSAYGARLCDLTRLPVHQLNQRLLEYGEHVAEEYNQYMVKLVKKVCANICGRHETLRLDNLVNLAIDGACNEYFAANSKHHGCSQFGIQSKLEQWYLNRFNYVLVMVLQEWIYNTLKSMNAHNQTEYWINFSIDEANRSLVLDSNVPISETQIRRLRERPAQLSAIIAWSESHSTHGQGLNLIRDLLWYGFNSRVRVLSEQETKLMIPLPIHKE